MECKKNGPRWPPPALSDAFPPLSWRDIIAGWSNGGGTHPRGMELLCAPSKTWRSTTRNYHCRHLTTTNRDGRRRPQRAGPGSRGRRRRRGRCVVSICDCGGGGGPPRRRGGGGPVVWAAAAAAPGCRQSRSCACAAGTASSVTTRSFSLGRPCRFSGARATVGTMSVGGVGGAGWRCRWAAWRVAAWRVVLRVAGNAGGGRGDGGGGGGGGNRTPRAGRLRAVPATRLDVVRGARRGRRVRSCVAQCVVDGCRQGCVRGRCRC